MREKIEGLFRTLSSAEKSILVFLEVPANAVESFKWCTQILSYMFLRFLGNNELCISECLSKSFSMPL